jgi:hypothetical protein
MPAVDPNGFDEEDLPAAWYEERNGRRPSWAAHLDGCVLLLVCMCECMRHFGSCSACMLLHAHVCMQYS